jgi:hypothetical protein
VLLAGTRTDFGTVFDRHAEEIYRYCARRIGTVPDAAGAALYGLTTVPGTRTLWTSGAMDGSEPGLPAPLVARLRT